MEIRKFMHLNLRKRSYNHQEREWLLQKSLSSLGPDEVLEVHSYGPVLTRPPGTDFLAGLVSVTFKDGPNCLISQVRRVTGSERSRFDSVDRVFYIDGRCIDSNQMARQTLRLLHRLHGFTPELDEVVVWARDVPEELLYQLDGEGRAFYVDVCQSVGLVVTVPVAPVEGLRAEGSLPARSDAMSAR